MLDANNSMRNQLNLEIFLHVFGEDGAQVSVTNIFDIIPFPTDQQCQETLSNGSKFHNLYICEVDTREHKEFLAENSSNRVDVRVKLSHHTGWWKGGYTIDGVLLLPITDE